VDRRRPGSASPDCSGPRLEALVGAGVFYGAAGSETTAMVGRDVFVVGAGQLGRGRPRCIWPGTPGT